MPRLISRQKQIPNGFRFFQPQTGWKAPRYASFETIVQSLIAHRKGNPFLTQKHGWATDHDTVANEVDEFNAKVCQQLGYKDYYVEGGTGGAAAPPPFYHPATTPVPPPIPPGVLAKLGAVAAGGRVLIEWINSGEESVPGPVAEARASVCAGCPQNGQGGWESYFTVPVSNAIRTELEKRRNWNLKTALDEKIGVCEACHCPLPLKVHMPIVRILSRMPGDEFNLLDPKCWIRAEKPG